MRHPVGQDADMTDLPGPSGHLLTLDFRLAAPGGRRGQSPLSLALDLRITRLDYLITAALAIGVVWLASRQESQTAAAPAAVSMVGEQRRGRPLPA
jgi:hypothetical protein